MLTTAVSTLMPEIFPLCVYTCTVHRALTSSVYSVCTVQTTPEPLPETGVLTNQIARKMRHSGHHYTATPLHPYNVDAHAKIPGGLFELCVYTNTVHWPRCTVLYSCTEFPLWPIRDHRKIWDIRTSGHLDIWTDRYTAVFIELLRN